MPVYTLSLCAVHVIICQLTTHSQLYFHLFILYNYADGWWFNIVVSNPCDPNRPNLLNLWLELSYKHSKLPTSFLTNARLMVKSFWGPAYNSWEGRRNSSKYGRRNKIRCPYYCPEVVFYALYYGWTILLYGFTNKSIYYFLQNNKLPLHIVILRDGVSEESQFAKLVINDGMQVSVKLNQFSDSQTNLTLKGSGIFGHSCRLSIDDTMYFA